MTRGDFPYTPALTPFQDADDAWTAEVRRVFGRDAGTARYQLRGKGDEGSELRRLHDNREAARAAWLRSADPQ